MALSLHQQAVEHITRAKRTLLLSHQHHTMDNLATMAAFGMLLNKLKKNFDAVIPQFEKDKYPSFLPADITIQPRLGASRAFHVTVNTNETPLSEMTYDLKNGVLDITLVPKHGSWSPQDVGFKYGQDRYDLVIIIGCTDLNAIGPLNQEQTDFLYRTTVINLDHDVTNEMWGQINLVQPTAVSSSEVLYHWINEWNPQLIDQSLATALLSGMISNTHSFRNASVTPHTLSIAAKLVELGADRERIVHELWRNKPINSLKLWGKALSRLNHDQELGFVWTVVSDEDFLESGAKPEEIDGVVHELLNFSSEASVTVIFKQSAKQNPEVRLYTQGTRSADEIARLFGAQGSKNEAQFIWPHQQTAHEAAEELKNRIRAKYKTQ